VAGQLLIRELALADGTSAQLQLDRAVLIDDGYVQWLGPTEEADATGAEVMDGGGATLIPGMVDAHSHLPGPAGSHWIQRFSDPPETLRQVGRATHTDSTNRASCGPATSARRQPRRDL
jgi:imidazolonepropionase-like amidohydrolase